MTLEDLAFPPTNKDLLERLQAPGRILQGGVQTRPIQPQPLDFAGDWGGAQRPTSEVEKININILALDLGTHTGWAIRDRDGNILYGTESFSPRKSWTPGQRWQRFRSWLSETIVNHQIGAIAYEEVRRHVGTEAAHVYGAFQALTEMCADRHNLVLCPVGVGTIKKQWTGNGAAKKDAMIAEARRRGFRVSAGEDNTADALAILDWAIKREVSGTIAPVVHQPKPRKTKTAPKIGTLL